MYVKSFFVFLLIILFSLSCFSQEENIDSNGIKNYKSHLVELNDDFVDTLSNKLIELLLTELNKKSKFRINRSDLCVNTSFIDTIDYRLVRSENIRFDYFMSSDSTGNFSIVDSCARENLKFKKEFIKFYYLDSYYSIGHKNEFNLLVPNSSLCKFEVHIEKYYEQENFLHTHVRLFPVANETVWKDLPFADAWFIIENWKTIPNYLIGDHGFLIEKGF